MGNIAFNVAIYITIYTIFILFAVDIFTNNRKKLKMLDRVVAFILAFILTLLASIAVTYFFSYYHF